MAPWTALLLVLALSAAHVSAFTNQIVSASSCCSLHAGRKATKVSMASTDHGGSARLLVSQMKHLGEAGSIRLILASQSPRRREILDMMGLAGRYDATPSPLDESALQVRLAKQSFKPIDYTRVLAEEKARALAEVLSKDATYPSTLVLGSDTIVDVDDAGILEKPKSVSDAQVMLRSLSGAWHKVHTGVAIFYVEGTNLSLVSSFTEEARVKFASLSEEDIKAYVATGEPMDKAGSYGIQGVGGQLVETIEGDFFTVMGLPMHRVSVELSQAIAKVKK